MNDKVIVVSGIAFLVLLAVLAIPLSQPTHSTATDVSNDLGYNLVNLGGSNSTAFNTNMPCSYLIFISGTATRAQNCNTRNIDFSSTDSSSTIQFALNKINVTGGEIYIQKGRYIINHPINFTGTAETVAGEGTSVNTGTWLDLGTNCNCNMFQYANSSKPTIFFPIIKDLYMQGEQSHNTKGNGTYFGGSNTVQLVKDFEMSGVYVDGFAQFGLVSNNAHDYRIIHGAMEHMGTGGTGRNFAIFIKTSDSIRIQDVLFRFAGIQLGCNTIGGINPDNLCGNKFVKGAIVTTNKIEGSNVTIENSAVVINNNVFDSMTTPFNNGFSSLNLRFNDTGTIITTNILNGSNVANNAVIIDNSTSRNVMLVSNQISQYKNNPSVSDSGTNSIIRANVGFITENSGTATILAVNTNVNVTHGLSYTPSINDIMITPQGNDFSCTSYWISSVNSTQFRINCNIAPTTSSLSFSWSIKRT